MTRHVVVHAHFYQPPREHPWYDEVERHPSAAPWHDWNERIERECYRTVVAARRHGPDGRIARVMNTLEWISFNVGPTLCVWMERHAPGTMRRIIDADRQSVQRLGHGNAIAQPYHHVILPLASRRDKQTEVRWGIRDFQRRFGREPEGMWLPETAVDDETLDVLAEAGIRFTVLAPGQLKRPPRNGLPAQYTTRNGRGIALFAYDGSLSHGVAFGGLLRDAERWADAVCAVAPESPGEPHLVSMATDGETYGHHHKFAELALAHLIDALPRRGVALENYASVLARHGTTGVAQLVEPSAWSCAHGVERWRSDCGCRMDGEANPSQAWRQPLRRAVEVVARELHEIFDREGKRLLRDSWAARDAWGAVVVEGSSEAREAFLGEWMAPACDAQDRARIPELMEMERDALRMSTSCAWFFDDIGGIEVQQNLRYMARAVALSGAGPRIEAELLAILQKARSNRPEIGTGADVYRRLTTTLDPFAAVAAASVALRAHGLDPAPHMPQAFQVDEDQGPLTPVVTHTPTGVRATFEAVPGPLVEGIDPVWRLTRAGGVTSAVPLADFPERARHVLRAHRRSELLPATLTPSELRQLASGEVTLASLVAVALARAIAALERRHEADALRLAHAMMDLFQQLEAGAPFDAQTAFWQVWSAATPARREELASLAVRLGFDLATQ